MNLQHWLATQYRDAGLSVIPIQVDGSKKPQYDILVNYKWEPYQTRFATNDELDFWFPNHVVRAVGIVTGTISGGLEVIDFDDGSLFPNWFAKVHHIASRLTIIATAGGGFHVMYRCKEICGSTKIAMDPSREKQTLVETRGQSAYIVAHGSPVGTHPSGRTYDIADQSGKYLPDVIEITPGERRDLWAAARSFDLRPPQRIESLRKRLNGHVQRHCDDHRPVEQRKESARKYISKMEPSISGSNGHGKAYAVACKLVGTFGLPLDDAMEIFAEFNQRCVPPWSDKEMMHKIEDAIGGKHNA